MEPTLVLPPVYHQKLGINWHRYKAELIQSTLVPSLDENATRICELECKAVSLRLRAKYYQPFAETEKWQSIAELDHGKLYNDKIVELMAGISSYGLHMGTNSYNINLGVNPLTIIVVSPLGRLQPKRKRETNALVHVRVRNDRRIAHKFYTPCYIESFYSGRADANEPTSVDLNPVVEPTTKEEPAAVTQ